MTIIDLAARLLGTDYATLAYYCGTPDPTVISLMLVSDFLTWASYTVIGGWFIMFVVRTQIMGWSQALVGSKVAQIFDGPLVALTGAFVVSCGNAHGIDILATAGRLEPVVTAYAHAATAVISVLSAGYLLWRARHAG